MSLEISIFSQSHFLYCLSTKDSYNHITVSQVRTRRLFSLLLLLFWIFINVVYFIHSLVQMKHFRYMTFFQWHILRQIPVTEELSSVRRILFYKMITCSKLWMMLFLQWTSVHVYIPICVIHKAEQNCKVWKAYKEWTNTGNKSPFPVPHKQLVVSINDYSYLI